MKGYGDTHISGTRNFDAVMSAVGKLRGTRGAADAVKRLREAALADDSGQRLSEALRAAVV